MNLGCNESRSKQAVKFCIECQQRFCEDCFGTHRRMAASKEHELIEIDDEEGMCAAVGRMTTVCCDKHPTEAMNQEIQRHLPGNFILIY